MQDGALSYSGIWPGNLNRLLLCPPFIAQILLELYIVGLEYMIKGHTLKTRHFMHVIVAAVCEVDAVPRRIQNSTRGGV